MYNLPNQKNLLAISVETSNAHLEKEEEKTDQGLQFLRVIRVLFEVEKQLEA